jgi:uncharacterized protein (TIGR02246 family)
VDTADRQFDLDFWPGGAHRRYSLRERRISKAMHGKMTALSALMLIMMFPLPSLSDDGEAAVRAVIQSFYKAFDEGFTGPADYAAEDWNHINPSGGRASGREATLKEVREVHKSFLKGTTDTIEKLDVRFASPDVAVGTVVSVMSPFTSPDGVKHGTERHIRTFIVVKHGDGWKIMQDQNTTIVEPH